MDPSDYKKMMLPVMVLLAFLASVWWAMHLFAETTNSDAWNRADVWNVERVSELCKEMLTRKDVLSACPSAQKHQRLRVDADIVYFPHLYKCSISVSALDAVSLYATIDVFPSSSQALERMKERTTEDYTHVLGNLLGMGEVQIALVRLTPGKLNDGFDPASNVAGFGVVDRELGQAFNFLVGLVQNHFGKVRRFDLLTQFLDIGIFFQFAQFLLDGTHAFAQDGLLHVLVKLPLSFVENFPLDLENLHLFRKTLADPDQPFFEIDFFEKRLFFTIFDVQNRGDLVTDLHRIGGADELHEGGDLDVVFAQVDRLLDLVADMIDEGGQFLIFFDDVGEGGNGGQKAAGLNFDLVDLDPLTAFDDGVELIVDRQGFDDLANGADRVEIFRFGVSDLVAFLGNETNLGITGNGIGDTINRGGAAEGEDRFGVGENDTLFEGNEGQNADVAFWFFGWCQDNSHGFWFGYAKVVLSSPR